MMIKYLASFRPQTLNDVLLGSKSLKAATAVAAETEVEAQVRESWGENGCHATLVLSRRCACVTIQRDGYYEKPENLYFILLREKDLFTDRSSKILGES